MVSANHSLCPLGCYSIWRKKRMRGANASAFRKTLTPLHIEREDGDGIHHHGEYAVSFWRLKGPSGNGAAGQAAGLDGLTVLLRSLGIAQAEIETACQGLTETIALRDP